MKLAAGFENVNELRKDLDAIADGLGLALAKSITEAAEPLATKTRAFTPVGEGPRLNARAGSDDALPHIRDTIGVTTAGGSIALYSTHPGAVVHEWGGTVAPSGVAIHIKPAAMSRKAAVAELPRIEEDVQDRIDRLIALHS